MPTSPRTTPATPPATSILLETRALAEIAASHLAAPLLRLAPRGDGHPVLVLPGVFADDANTTSLRRFLNRRGFLACPGEVGRNPGVNLAFCERLEQRVRALAIQHGIAVSLVGFSLGGIYARIIAHRLPSEVRAVITLASPFRLDLRKPATNVMERAYERLKPESRNDPMHELQAIWQQPPPVPTTSIYSESDGVAHWRSCRDAEGDKVESIRIPATHLGITYNPLARYIVADRLSQPAGEWQHFRWPTAY